MDSTELNYRAALKRSGFTVTPQGRFVASDDFINDVSGDPFVMNGSLITPLMLGKVPVNFGAAEFEPFDYDDGITQIGKGYGDNLNQSFGGNKGSAKIVHQYKIFGAANADDAYLAFRLFIIQQRPLHGGLLFESVTVDESTDAEEFYTGSVTYSSKAYMSPKNMPQYSFSTKGGTAQTTQSLKTVKSWRNLRLYENKTGSEYEFLTPLWDFELQQKEKETEKTALESELYALVGELSVLQKELQQRQRELASLQMQLVTLQNTDPDNTAGINALQNQINSKEQQVDSVQSAVDSKQDDIDSKQEEITDKQTEIDTVLGDINGIYTEARVRFPTPDYKGGIGYSVEDGSFAGVQRVVPAWSSNVSLCFPFDYVDGQYKKLLRAMTGSVNSVLFDGMEPGECLFMGADGSTKMDEDNDGNPLIIWDMKFDFQGQTNAKGLTVGGVSGIEKEGWDYMWVLRTPVKDAESKMTVHHPLAVYVERLYLRTDFAALGLN